MVHYILINAGQQSTVFIRGAKKIPGLGAWS